MIPEKHQELSEFLEAKYQFYNQPSFIGTDPVSIPHLFSDPGDIEIAGLLTATIAWGNRKSIISNGRKLMKLMDDSPARFILQAQPKELRALSAFVHRTFNGEDCLFFISALKNIFRVHGSLEPLFGSINTHGVGHAIKVFRNAMLTTPHLRRSEKHLPDPDAGSAAKRLNMFLRWMVRNDGRGVDFGIWKSISAANLVCPLDIHSGRMARKLGLLERKQNDWKAAIELTNNLRLFDPDDPVKFDFALFGPGICEKS